MRSQDARDGDVAQAADSTIDVAADTLTSRCPCCGGCMRIIETFERGETSGGYRRDHLRALAQRVEVDTKEVRIMGSKSVLLRTLVAASSAKTAGFGVQWRATADEDGHYCFAVAL